MKKTLNILIYITAAGLMCAAFLSYFSFNYFYLYGHIQSFSDFAFCLFQWFKLAGLAVVAAAVFLKSKRFCAVLKYFYVLIPLFSLFWAEKYFGLSKTPVTETDYIFYSINNFMPAIAVKILFFAEAGLMSLAAVLVGLRDGYSFKEGQRPVYCGSFTAADNPANRRCYNFFSGFFHGIKNVVKSFVHLLPVMALCIPLNIFNNIAAQFNQKITQFFLFSNFGIWHFAALLALAAATAAVYFFLKNKDREKRYKYLSMLAVVLLIQYMSRASMLIGDGYNIYRTIISFAPLFVCNIGVFIASLAIFTKNKVLSDIAFFVHAGGAVSVFVYFGRPDMSEFNTVFSYTFLYFTLTHALLFILCVMPVFLKEHAFKFKNCAVPLCYYAIFIIAAAVTSQLISSVTFTYGALSQTIYPNFSFTQISPIKNSLPPFIINVLGLSFDVLYLSILFAAYTAIFFATCALYYFTLGRKGKRERNVECRM